MEIFSNIIGNRTGALTAYSLSTNCATACSSRVHVHYNN